MAETLLLIFFGWLLGLFASRINSRSDRNQMINDFISGLYSQLLEIHPRLVANVISIETDRKPLSYKTVQWVTSMLPASHDFYLNKEIKTVNEMLLKHPKEEFKTQSERY